jgi:hypothetical protein
MLLLLINKNLIHRISITIKMSAYFLIYASKTGLERTKTAANTPTANIGTNNTPHLSIKYQTVPPLRHLNSAR